MSLRLCIDCRVSQVDRFPVICGATASGKTDLAVAVALRLGGEIVTADAFQIYRGMDIGTAKPTHPERQGVPHHLIDVVDPGADVGPTGAKRREASDRFTVADWLGRAERALADIASRGRVPIVVGGTHLYIKMLMEGMFEGPSPDPELRAELEATPLAVLRAELERVDVDAAARIHPADDRRTRRAIEVYRQTGTPISVHQSQWDEAASREARAVRLEQLTGRRPVVVALEWPTEELNRRINARVRVMMEAGLLNEVRELWSTGRLPAGSQAREALGYAQLVDHLEGRCSLDEAVEQIKILTRRFGKAQRTWLRRLAQIPGTAAIDRSKSDQEAIVSRVVGMCAV
jgi:tRNA dimethylallyltransferase